jgi:hyaluronan synthase
LMVKSSLPPRRPPTPFPPMSYFVIYGVAALCHILVQVIFGHVASVRDRIARDPSSESATPSRSITVVVPIYNEEPEVVRRTLDSIANQDHPNFEVIVVDDGSQNQEENRPVYGDFVSLPGWTIALEPTNRGKRLAQKVGFDMARGDLIVTIDSDTELHTPDALRRIERRFADARVGAVCGNVGVINKKSNLLSRLISYRYWMAFHQERAAQSLFGVTMCCSGPFSAYRGELIVRLKEKYVRQHFLGDACTFGDDRHLTNLVLREGYRVVFDEHAHARTEVPTNIRSYLKQQLRWNKSFYREALWTARFARRRNVYLWFDLILQLVLPFMLVAALGAVAYRTVALGFDHVVAYGLVVLGIATLRSLYGLARTRDLGFMLFSVYGFMHVGLLIPTRLYALTTMRKTHWGTRGAADASLPPSRARRLQFAGAAVLLLTALLASSALGMTAYRGDERHSTPGPAKRQPDVTPVSQPRGVGRDRARTFRSAQAAHIAADRARAPAQPIRRVDFIASVAPAR